MRLRPYKACDAKYIVNWIQDKRTFYQWSADRINVFPLTEEALNHHYKELENTDTFWEFTATNEDNIPIGHLIMRYTDFQTVNLGFVIVDNTLRGRGFGRKLVEIAKDYAFIMLHARKVTLGVFTENEQAKHCYKAAGFSIPKGYDATYKVPIEDEQWECVSMECKN